MIFISLLPVLFLLSSAVATSHAPGFHPHRPYNARPRVPHGEEPDASKAVFHIASGAQISAYDETYYFDQLIDHTDPSKGTFKQRYWHNYEYYEPGESSPGGAIDVMVLR